MLRVKGLDREHPEVIYCLVATLNRRYLKGTVENYDEYMAEFVEDIRNTLPYTMSYEPFKAVGDRETLFFLSPITTDNPAITDVVLYTPQDIYAFAEKWPEVLPQVYYTSVEDLQNSFIPSTATIH